MKMVKKMKEKLQSLSGVISVVVMSIFVMAGCRSKPAIDITDEGCFGTLESFLQNDSFKPLDKEAGTVFYADASEVLKDAMRNSPVYGEMKKQISQYVTDLVFIKGDSFDTIPCDRSSQSIFTALERMASQPEVPYANILAAIENICNGDREAMIITDFEQQKDGQWMDEIPYLSEPFKKWLQKGYQIDILVEQYTEGRKNDLKNRFYVFFTDPTDNTAINHTMISQVKNYINDGTCAHLTFNPKDYGIVRTNKQLISEIDISTTAFEKSACQSYVIDDSWDGVVEFLMKIDKHGQPIEGEEPVALIDNLKMVDGSLYSIENIQLKATNISKPFLKKMGEEVDSEEIWDISDAFDVKKDHDVVQLFVNKKILNERHLFSEDDGFMRNLIKIEFLVADGGCKMKESDLSQLEWTSARPGANGKKATCVSLSMDNALKDANVVPYAPQNRVLYTIFLQTESKK